MRLCVESQLINLLLIFGFGGEATRLHLCRIGIEKRGGKSVRGGETEGRKTIESKTDSEAVYGHSSIGERERGRGRGKFCYTG